MKRYSKPEVDGALEQTERGVFEPHSQMVLAGEVQALRLQERTASRCQQHGVPMYAGSTGELECWYCHEKLKMQQRIEATDERLRSARAEATSLHLELDAARRKKAGMT